MSAKEKKPSRKGGLNIKTIGGILLSKMARGGAFFLKTKADEVNKLNVFPVPDGDTGDNMRMTIESGIAAIENMDSDDLAEVMKTLSHGMLLGARGNSGVILSRFFAGLAKGLEKSKNANPKTFAHALEIGVEFAYSSVMTPTEGTILTVAREAVEYAVSNLTPESTIRTLFADLLKEMHASLDRTPQILSVLKEAGVVDSGGAGLLYIMDGFNRVLNGEEIADSAKSSVAAQAAQTDRQTQPTFNRYSHMVYGYCTEILLQLMAEKTDVDAFDLEPLKAYVTSIGDSVVAYESEGIVKLHVHTFTPEKVLAYCRRYGEFLQVKIENMSVQHTKLDSAEPADIDKPPTPEKKPIGVVVVCNGSGMKDLFRELGADVIIEGGQTHNPSTTEFLEAFDKTHAEHILVFPNNSNIFMAANQAAEIYTASDIHILDSKNIGAAYAALSCVMLDTDEITDILSQMHEAMSRITAGYISPSIRDAEIGGIHIEKGDTIGIIEKDIVVSCPNRLDAVISLVSMLLAHSEESVLTVFCGEDATQEEQDALASYLSENHAQTEVFFMNGDQAVYPYIFIVE